jgi:vitamin B12/bleomycin/antimicrobial peptide transport system ATP-binding/permease protein
MWSLIRPYWVSEDRWRGRLLFIGITLLTLATVWVNVRLNGWNGDFYNALQDKKFEDFKRLLLEFVGWAFLYIILVVYTQYFTQMLQMRWRRWMTEVYLERWMSGSAFYRMGLVDLGSDNPDQRIAEDMKEFVNNALSLFFGLLNAVVSFVSFVGILWALSGPITLGSGASAITIPGYMVWVALAYSMIGSLIAHWVGKPLIKLNFDQERYEADFRYSLVRARENAEGIALYRGEQGELGNFKDRFGHLMSNWWEIMKRQKRFTWFSSFYGQLALVFPILVASPRYFSGAIQLGGLMQIASAFGQVQSSLSWFVDAYGRIASWRASIQRLQGFQRAIDLAQSMGAGLELAHKSEHSGSEPKLGNTLDLHSLKVFLPEAQGSSQAKSAGLGRLLIEGGGERIDANCNTLIEGPSGSGKSILFRTLAGIWPFASGKLETPSLQDVLFLPQKPYLPLGSLRTVTCYPGTLQDDASIQAALQKVELPELADRLDEQALWSQMLSGGEQQRLALARALLIKPRWLFLDEATSAVDEAMEARLYGLLASELPETTLVSIAHRPQVARFHRQRLRLSTKPGVPVALTLEPI